MKQFYAVLFFVITFFTNLSAQDFRITVQVTNADRSFSIPTIGTGYDYQVRWRDPYSSGGLIVQTLFSSYDDANPATTTYPSAGTYTITIRGDFPRIYFNNNAEADKVISIEQWGNNQWTSMEGAFYGCANLEVNATDAPNLSQTTSLENMFRDCPKVDFSLAGWNVSTITNMRNMFNGGRLSTDNYDATLIAWNQQNLRSAVRFDAGASSYCNAAGAHLNIADPDGSVHLWNITDGGQFCEEDKFITTWQTTTASETITVPSSGTRNYTIEWGDGTFDTNQTGNATHTYAVPDNYQVKIYGDFPRIYFNNKGDRNKILTVEQWGKIEWTSFESAFYGCGNLDVVATDAPNLSSVTNLRSMFYFCSSLGTSDDLDFSGWDTGGVTNFYGVFGYASNFNSASISNWNVGSGTDFSIMFANATSFNQNINSWNIGTLVTGQIDMGFMFASASNFNQPLNNWDMSKVWDVGAMFASAVAFNQNLGDWDISSITQAGDILDRSGLSTSNYESSLQGWATLSAGETRVPTNITLGAKNLEYCTPTYRSQLKNNYQWEFEEDIPNCPEEEKFITTWQVASGDLTIPIYMFNSTNDYMVDWGDGTFSENITANTTHTYTSAGTYTVKIFGDFSQLYFFNRDGKEKIRSIEQWGTNQWTGLDFSFYGCSNIELNADDIPDLSQATSIGAIFQNATSFTDAKDKLKDWDVSTITNFSQAFQGTAFNRDISGWNMQAAEAINLMFAENTVFNQPIGVWTFNNLKESDAVFQNATNFNQDLANWNMSKVEFFNQMFSGATAFDQSLGTWDISSARGAFSMQDMFLNTALSTQNYDDTLIGWATLDSGETRIPTDVNFHGGNSNYCVSANAHVTLKDDNFKWTITDGGLLCDEEDKFITTWKTTSNNESIQIRTTGSTSTFAVDWGDGTSTGVNGSSSHTYASPGTYTVKVSGTIGQLYANNQSVSDKMQSVEQWGASKFTSFRRAFAGADNVVINATDIPDLSGVTSFEDAFDNCKKLVDNGGQMQHWDVSNVQNFTEAFREASLFNVNLGNWDLSNATTLAGMLNGTALTSTNYDATLTGWANNPNTPNSLNLGASGLTYCTAEAARTTLDVTKSWTISDAGLGCNDDSTAFITTWQTTTANQTLTIPTTGGGYDYIIDWGDGSQDTGLAGNASHEYAVIGDYQIKIWGDFPRIYFNNTGDKEYIRSIDQWGTIQWSSMKAAFKGCSHLVVDNNAGAPDLSGVTILANMFESTAIDTNGNLNSWNVENVTDFYRMFFVCPNFNQPLDQWNVSNAISLRGIFHHAINFNQDISGWNVGKCRNFAQMFLTSDDQTHLFNQDISSWNVGAFVTETQFIEMYQMFKNAKNFDADLSGWDVSRVSNFNQMFYNSLSFDYNLGNWDIGNASDMELMFNGVTLSTENYDNTLIGWSTLSATETVIPIGLIFDGGKSKYCFGESARTQLSTAPFNWTITDGGLACSATDFFVTTWTTVTSNESITIPTTGNGYNYDIDWGDGTFETALTGNATHEYTTAGTYTVRITGDFPRIYFNDSGDKTKIKTIEQWGSIAWLNMNEAFSGCSSLELNADDTPNLSGVEDLSSMFRAATNFIDKKDKIGTWDVGTITNFSSMFQSASNFNENINSWNIGEHVTGDINMGIMFDSTTVFNQPLNDWDISKVTNISAMFSFALAFNQPLHNWDTRNVENMGGMFFGAQNFDQNIGDWNLSSVTSMVAMFQQSGLSNKNYDNILIGWAQQDAGETIPSDISISFEGSMYCFGTTARNTLTNNAGFNWSILDDGAACDITTAFITTWNIASDNEEIVIPVIDTGLDFDVDWGDGVITYGETEEAYHTYAKAGTYTITVLGDFKTVRFNNGPDSNKILAIEQWGSNAWTTMQNSFLGCENLTLNATDIPDLSNVTNMNFAFSDTSDFADNGGELGNWNVTNVELMQGVFMRSNMNENINAWNVVNVKDISNAFAFNIKFNQPLNDWELNNLTTISGVFNEATAFNQPLNNWNVSGVDSLFNCFNGASAFNQPLDNWDVSGISNFQALFFNASSFNQDLGSWDISNATNINFMLKGTDISEANYDSLLIGWQHLDSDETQVPTNLSLDVDTTTYCLGAAAKNILESDLYNWTINDGDASCNDADFFITTWQTTTDNESITIPTSSFYSYNYKVDWGDNTGITVATGNTTHTYQNAGTYTVKIIGEFPSIFINRSADKDKLLSIEQWGTQKWAAMNAAFRGCSNLVLNATDTPDLSVLTRMDAMFKEASSFVDNGGEINNWITSNVVAMNSLFEESAFNENINNWDVRNAGNMSSMFKNNTVFNQPLDQWVPENVSDFANMFEGASSFNQPIENWNIALVHSFEQMFDGATAFDQSLAKWNISNADSMDDMLVNSGLSTKNYDATLIGWATLDTASGETQIPTGVTFDTNTAYCTSTDARNILSTTPYNWTITDGGQNCDFNSGFITTWQTFADNETITIPTTGSGYNYAIDWGDGTIEFGKTGNASHQYGRAGNYQVKIVGEFPQIHMQQLDVTRATRLQSVDQWGNIEWQSMFDAFNGAVLLRLKAIDAPNLTAVTNMQGMFSGCTALVDEQDRIGIWDTKNVTNMSYLFENATVFNEELSKWTTSNVTNFESMFENATSFDQDLGNWSIENVKNMTNMFAGITLSTGNYDNTLLGWGDSLGKTEPANINFHGGNSTYCLADTIVEQLVRADRYNWTITDGGQSCDNAFIITWQVEDGDLITIPTVSGFDYDYNIDWGDDFYNYGRTNQTSKLYATGGTYTVTISGKFPALSFGTLSKETKAKLVRIEQWGEQRWERIDRAFDECVNLKLNANDIPDLSLVTSTSNMFKECTNFEDLKDKIGSWDMSNITHISSMFRDCTIFNENISGWSFNALERSNSTFNGAAAFNQNIANWDMSSIDEMESMFRNATAFNQPIGSWTLGTIDYINSIFEGATAFNQDISNWNFGNVYEAYDMFNGATAFNQDLSKWDISNVESLDDFFTGSGMSQENYDKTLIGWATIDTAAGETTIPANLTLNAHIAYCLSETAHNTLTSGPYNWTINDAGKVCPGEAFITTWLIEANDTILLPIDTTYTYNYTINWGDGTVQMNQTGEPSHTYTSAGTYTITITGDFPTMRLDFGVSKSREKIQTIEQWGTQQWASFSSTFGRCTSLKLNADDVPDLSQLTSLNEMFTGCTNFEDLKDNIGSWDVSTVETISGMFAECTIFNEDITGWVFTNLLNTSSTFSATSRFNQDISNWNMSKVINMVSMFEEAAVFNQPIGNWTLGAVEFMNYVFYDAPAFNQDLSNWDFSTVTEAPEMFYGASKFNQDLSSWDISKINEDFGDFFVGAGISSDNYDKTLIGWATLDTAAGETTIPANNTLGTDATYCLGEVARNTLTAAPYNWTITDGGLRCTEKANINVYLLGAALNPKVGEENLMRDDLRRTAVMPSTSLYSDAIRTTESVLTNDSVAADSVVDWVWVELRDATNVNTVIEGRSALLQRDGDVVDVDGTSPVEFVVDTGNYYVVVNHRNHLGIRSKDAISFDGSAANIDFSSTSANIEGESNAVIQLPNGKYAMIGGDTDSNGQVQNGDINTANQFIGSSGYQNADSDMNGQVQNSDIQSIIIQNSGKGQQF